MSLKPRVWLTFSSFFGSASKNTHSYNDREAPIASVRGTGVLIAPALKSTKQDGHKINVGGEVINLGHWKALEDVAGDRLTRKFT